MSIEQQIDELTKELSEKCGGKPSAVVVAATMNLLVTTLQQVPDKNLLAAAADTMRHMANQFQKISGGVRH